MGSEAASSGDGATALAVLALIAGDLTRLFESVHGVDWDRPTPCTEWTLGDLTEHVTGGNRFTIRILSGDTSADAMASARRSFAEDRDTRRSLVTSTLELVDHLGVAGVLDQIYHHVDGDLSGHEVLRLRLHDLIIHTWDLAQVLQATPARIRPELVSWALADISADELTARHFGLELPTDGDASSDQDTLLSAFGRRTP
ncbi:MAG: maleylpyruvate isomerase N-terminal domain-containing protein [Nitriliruptor sp.]|uniref:maleylpyruvate isomerase N-terminal domain-containing protein n=1 Tax=Nitriliruptor sp. TaxID=2448056 RepID=UPI0034A09C09